jgi:hypothetical protein
MLLLNFILEIGNIGGGIIPGYNFLILLGVSIIGFMFYYKKSSRKSLN